MAHTAWRTAVLESLANNKSLPYAKYVQLATVRPDGKPACRTVVFRGFLNETDTIQFVTDNRSRKVEEIAKNPSAEVAWYLPNSREQYRMSGTLQVVNDEEKDPFLAQARRDMWARQSEGAQAQYAWPEPGLPRDINPDAFSPTPEQVAAMGPVVPAFALLLFTVAEVDHVLLRENRRIVYERVQDGNNGSDVWSCAEVNP
ncbi:hypothetical protein CYMTET_55054 [Cymbomonas tetramitiformis]|uniref:Pyridoxamine 5'-phosphate oxidase Alr4036 family FMN-binding domain-containing protein n=1 Tax=Cymbomonas tetramitiformis TaxID=36881 RepID=A0AAE0BF20_9CHLO|nr:hypothetical protein CYMTET_55054 [Cymbomonas tetramitiformis]